MKKAIRTLLAAAALAALPFTATAEALSLRQIMDAAEEATLPEFKKLLETAAADGTPAQVIMEAQMVYPFRTGDFRIYAEALPAIEKAAPEWDYSKSELFQDKNGLQSLIETMRAQIAFEVGDAANFEKHVKEAFWLDPKLGTILARWVGDFRQAEAMKAVKLPMDTELLTSKGEKTSLSKLADGKKAVLLDFWATWCGPCVRLMPELVAKAETLEPQGILVAGINTEADPEKAEKFRVERDIKLTWLVEPAAEPFSKALMIDSIPRMILVQPDGTILYNGHPSDPKLSEALAKIDVKL